MSAPEAPEEDRPPREAEAGGPRLTRRGALALAPGVILAAHAAADARPEAPEVPVDEGPVFVEGVFEEGVFL
jgi:hypothetical protein